MQKNSCYLFWKVQWPMCELLYSLKNITDKGSNFNGHRIDRFFASIYIVPSIWLRQI